MSWPAGTRVGLRAWVLAAQPTRGQWASPRSSCSWWVSGSTWNVAWSMSKCSLVHWQSRSRMPPTPSSRQRRVGHGDVRRQRRHAAGDRPGVQVVDVDDPGHAARAGRGRRRGRGPCGAISSSTTAESLSRCSERGRISTAITSEAIGSARWKSVSQMTTPATTASTEPSRSANTSVAAPRRLRLPVSDRFRIASETALASQADEREPDHRPGLDGRRVDQPGDAGVRQVGADHQQHQGVEQRGQDLGAVPAERRARSGRSGGDVRRPEREHDRGGVGGHVAGVGEQRQRAGDPGADQLDHHHRRGDDQHQPQPRRSSARPAAWEWSWPMRSSASDAACQARRLPTQIRPCGSVQPDRSGPSGTMPDGLMSWCTT